jgi:hypothetical protein
MPYTGIRSFRSDMATLENELSGMVFELEAGSHRRVVNVNLTAISSILIHLL